MAPREPEIVNFDLDSFVQPHGYIAELAKKVAVLFLDENIYDMLMGYDKGHAYFWMKRSLGLWPDLGRGVGSLKQLILDWGDLPFCLELFELNFPRFTDFDSNRSIFCIPKSRPANNFYILKIFCSFSWNIHHSLTSNAVVQYDICNVAILHKLDSFVGTHHFRGHK